MRNTGGARVASTQMFTLSTCAALLLVTRPVAGTDFQVLLGPSQVGSWSVTGDAANRQPVIAVMLVDRSPETFVQGICTVGCFPPILAVPALGAENLDVALHGWSPSISTLYLSGLDGTQAGLPLPALRVRMVDQANPVRAVDVPLFSLSSLMAGNLSTLDFAGVTLEGSAHSNLVLGNILKPDASAGEELPILLELFDSQGVAVGSISLTLSYGQTVVIGDIVSYLGSGQLPLGHLRITRTSGAALMWGILYTVDSNGAVSASVGWNASS